MDKREICLFASYYKGDSIPYYQKIYLLELKKHISEIVFIVSNKNIESSEQQFLQENGISLLFADNNGFDFGKWHSVLTTKDLSHYTRIYLVNDSCILFAPLNNFMQWSYKTSSDILGITLSEAVNKHIQSYFLVLNKKAIPFAINYFKQVGILNTIQEVIKTYEVGLGKYFSENGLLLEAFIDNDGYKGEYSPYYYCINHHLSSGMPLIKKKIFFATYRKDELFNLARQYFNIDVDYYISLIKKNNKTLIIDFDRVKNESGNSITFFSILKYKLTIVLLKLFRPFFKIIKSG